MSKTDFPKSVLSENPVVHPSVFIAQGARVMGNVWLDENVSVWYNAVLRGDINAIRVGARSNIQDGCIMHLENDRPCIVGQDCTIGHGAILHGCTLDDGVLVGMGAILLNGAVVGKGSVIGAGAVVKEDMVIPDYSLVVGVPGRIVKTLDPSTYDTHVAWAAKYVQLSRAHRNRFVPNKAV